jgi:hypothetical protein
MKRIKISLVALLLFASVGITLATGSAKEEQTVQCSRYPNGQGGIGTPVALGCIGTTPTIVCCYRIPDNWQYYYGI